MQAEILQPPTITLSLSVGPPGTVTTVTGRHFPGLRPVLLQWSTGVQFNPPNPIVAQDDGTFVAQYLVVFGDDVYGPRELQAVVSVFGVAPGVVAVVAQAPFLVVPHTAEPPVVDIIRALWGSLPFFFRH
ncbi:MAG: hypothetical protein ABSA21_11425 [Candidatus Limnocylindrales bacterium]|jgi:hypothetical protein